MFDAVRRWKERLFRSKKGGVAEKPARKVVKAKKKEVHKQGRGSRWGGSYNLYLHQCKLPRKRRAKNKMARKSRQINRRKKK